MIVSTGLDAVRPDQLHDADRSSGFPYARAARSGPFVIGKTMPPDPAHVSSVDQLDCVLQRLLVFNSGLPHEYRSTRLQEERVLPRIEDIVDALAAIQPALDTASGGGPDWWDNEAVPVLKDVVTWLRSVAADWGWEPYLSPSLRQAAKEERRERFREEYERPSTRPRWSGSGTIARVAPERFGNAPGEDARLHTSQ